MTALEEMKAALQEARTEAATLRIRVRELEAKLVEVANACDPAVVAERATHAFLPTPFYPHQCDAKVDEDGRIRVCGRPQSEHTVNPVGGPEQDRGAAALRPAESHSLACEDAWEQLAGSCANEGGLLPPRPPCDCGLAEP